MTGLLTSVAKMAGVSLNDMLLKEAEGLVALYFACIGTSDFATLASVIFLYVRSHFKRSVVNEIMDFARSTLESMVPQVGLEVDNDGFFPDGSHICDRSVDNDSEISSLEKSDNGFHKKGNN
jgi:hypothetical protein